MSDREVIGGPDFIASIEPLFSHVELAELILTNPYIINRLENISSDPLSIKHPGYADIYRRKAIGYLTRMGYSEDLAEYVMVEGEMRMREGSDAYEA